MWKKMKNVFHKNVACNEFSKMVDTTVLDTNLLENNDIASFLFLVSITYVDH